MMKDVTKRGEGQKLVNSGRVTPEGTSTSRLQRKEEGGVRDGVTVERKERRT